MFIKELILDGFKSYPNRTVISGWDKQFNAITGLNGSGKSNILDAICFVLGISNLSQVRVNNLQELVYKQGQARVNKASVTVVFDNRDPKASPVGYEQYDEITVTRQVVIGGRNKYLINGHTAQLSRVQNLFHSVQLNVNNPHFLIMQGRITKVVNMKPPEVLSMIEEAAGTRMYESKKKLAQQTIAKKQIKCDEINELLVNGINPQLKKLKKERKSYMKYQANNTEIERLTRFTTAASFQRNEQLVEQGAQQVAAMEADESSLNAEIAEWQGEVAACDEQVKELQEKKSADMAKEYKKLEASKNGASKKLVEATTLLENAKDTLKVEEKAHAKLLKTIAKQTAEVKHKQEESEALKASAAEILASHHALETKLAALKGQQLGVNMSDNNEKSQGSLPEQLMEAQRCVAASNSTVKQLKTKATMVQKQLGEKKKALAAAKAEFTKLEKVTAAKKAALSKAETDMSELKVEGPEAKARLEKKAAALEASCDKLRAEQDKLSSRLGNLNFEFNTQGTGLSNKNVKGIVAKLFSLKNAGTSTALQIAAGSRLYNVVVDDEKTGKNLLQKGGLRRRITIIPLNKIAARTISQAKVDMAEKLVGKENCQTALSLVGYEAEMTKAMEFVFGNVFVCKDQKTAEAVTFNKQIAIKSVTLQGDVFDPRGTLSGGSAPTTGNVLKRLGELNKMEAALGAEEKALTQVKQQLADMVQAEEKAGDLIMQRDLFSHDLTLSQNRLEQCNFSQIKKAVDMLEAELVSIKTQIAEQIELAKTQEALAKQLERQIKDFEGERKKQKAMLAKSIADTTTALTKSNKQHSATQQKLESLDAEAEQLQEEMVALHKQVTDSEKQLDKCRDEVSRANEDVKDKRAQFDMDNEKLEGEKQKLAATDNKIGALKSQKRELTDSMAKNTLELKKLRHKLAQLKQDAAGAKKLVATLLKRESWIADEKHLFGAEGTDYDFKKNDPANAVAKLQELRNEQEELSKKINKKVMGMFESAETEYHDLIKKRNIILKDKSTIENVITELDRKKNEALETTHKKVNKDFGSIFGTLLPGAQAKLDPPEGKSVHDGLELRVGFGGVWKASLTELSGGQRSLLALSLILALLLFKPAPMYILDEIDAALDLSHTQNIGRMLKTHFSQSQFIVVSLKEGMFNNANVLFRTKFIDGVSTVARTASSARGKH